MRGYSCLFFCFFALLTATQTTALGAEKVIPRGRPHAGPTPFSLHGARAIWTSREEIVYHPRVSFGRTALRYEALQIETGQRWPLSSSMHAGREIRLRFQAPMPLEEWVREPVLLLVSDSGGREIDRTYFQTAALLDLLYRFDGCLGVCFEGGDTVLRVWAPTARSVKVVWKGGGSRCGSELAMKRGEQGTWEAEGSSSWHGCAYLYKTEVFSPVTGRVETFSVTDPYSVALATGSTASVVLDLRDSRWKPAGWDSTRRPALASRNDTVLYELHVRDFSVADTSVPSSLRGTYKAFTLDGTDGDRHLRALAEAGVTHVHLLPVYDFTSVEEDPARRRDPIVSDGLPSDSPLPQEAITRLRTLDSYNWGYDPWHYLVPEGSYAQAPEGGARVLEMREMVQALHRKGLRVVLDMVFNHTFAAGLADESVLDKIVPLYYHRLDHEGLVRNSSCCSDTASERWMMEKLMRDALELWRAQYKIDGFRFDLMNLHSVATMARLRDFLRRKDPSVVLYGEAWAFGSLMEKDGDAAFTQGKAYGQQIGVFNDRMRDAIRGGTTDSKEKSDPGYVTGLFYDFNHEPANRNTPLDMGQQRGKLLWLGDILRIGLAGNLRDWRFTDHRGNRVRGGDIQFKGGAVGYARDPEDNVNYVSAHDGYTLWDALQAKLPFHTRTREPDTVPMQERVDRQVLALGLVALSQGIPFFDSGAELLRSKSGDQNSYDSGDWFNSLDWSGHRNGWGLGLPPHFSNPDDWPFWRPRLADPALQPSPEHIASAKERFLELLRVRKSSPLFRLRSGAEIQGRVRFLETELGPMQPPGLLVMELLDEEADGRDLDPKWKRILAGVNVTNDTAVFPHQSLGRAPLERMLGRGDLRLVPSPSLVLPPRTITVWGEK